MADLLSSASLLIAIVAVLYGLWYPDIKRGIETKVGLHLEPDKVSDVKGIMFRRALPLAISSLGLGLVFLKDTVRIVFSSVRSIRSSVPDHFRNYDAVSTAFVFVEFIWMYVALQLLGDLYSLAKKHSQLKSSPPFKA